MSQFGYSTDTTVSNYTCGVCTQASPNGPWNCTSCNFVSASGVPQAGDSVVFATTAVNPSLPNIGRSDNLIFNGRVVRVDQQQQRIMILWLATQKASPIRTDDQIRGQAWMIPDSVIKFQYPQIYQTNTPFFNTDSAEWYNRVGFNSQAPITNPSLSPLPFSPQPPSSMSFDEWNTYIRNRVLVHYPQPQA